MMGRSGTGRPRSKTSDLADFLRGTGPDGLSSGKLEPPPMPSLASDPPASSKRRIPFLGRKKKSLSFLSSSSASQTDGSSPVSDSVRVKTLQDGQTVMMIAPPLNQSRTLSTPTSARSIVSHGDVSPSPLGSLPRKSTHSKRRSSSFSISPPQSPQATASSRSASFESHRSSTRTRSPTPRPTRPQITISISPPQNDDMSEDIFTSPRTAPSPPSTSPISTHFPTEIDSPSISSSPASRMHFPYPPDADSRSQITPPTKPPPSESTDSVRFRRALDVDRPSPSPAAKRGKNNYKSRDAASLSATKQPESQLETEPSIRKRPSKVRLGWADSLPLSPLVAPGEQSPTSNPNSVKSPTSTSVRSTITAFMDEMPLSDPPTIPLPPAPSTASSFTSLPTIPSLTSFPSTHSTRQTTPGHFHSDSLSTQHEYPEQRFPLMTSSVSSHRSPGKEGQHQRGNSRDELMQELALQRTRCDELARLLQKMSEMHEIDKIAYEKRMELLERDAIKRDKEVRGLRWLVMNGTTALKLPLFAVTTSSSDVAPVAFPPASTGRGRRTHRADSDGSLPLEEPSSKASGLLRRSRTLPRNLSLADFSQLSKKDGKDLPSTLTNQGGGLRLTFAAIDNSSLSQLETSPTSSSLPTLTPASTASSGLSAIPESPSSTSPDVHLQDDNPAERKLIRALNRLSSSSTSSSVSAGASIAYTKNLNRGRSKSIGQVLDSSPNTNERMAPAVASKNSS